MIDLNSPPLQAQAGKPPHHHPPPPAGPRPYDPPAIRHYLKELKGRMFWASERNKGLLLAETRSHMNDLMDEFGGVNDQTALAAVERFGPAEEVARRYLQTHGYGIRYFILVFAVAMVIGLFSVPIFVPVCGLIALIASIGCFIWIIWVATKAGKWAGLTAGLGCAFSRTISLGAISSFTSEMGDSEGLSVVVAGESACGLIFVSLLMIITGYLAGHTIKKIESERAPAWDA